MEIQMERRGLVRWLLGSGLVISLSSFTLHYPVFRFLNPPQSSVYRQVLTASPVIQPRRPVPCNCPPPPSAVLMQRYSTRAVFLGS